LKLSPNILIVDATSTPFPILALVNITALPECYIETTVFKSNLCKPSEIIYTQWRWRTKGREGGDMMNSDPNFLIIIIIINYWAFLLTRWIFFYWSLLSYICSNSFTNTNHQPPCPLLL
jgi:hypothetical protein